MKRLLKPITASTKMQDIGLSFYPAEIVVLLKEIQELNGLEIDFSINGDGNVEFIVGENAYVIVDM